jgi:hypothetical protein
MCDLPTVMRWTFFLLAEAQFSKLDGGHTVSKMHQVNDDILQAGSTPRNTKAEKAIQRRNKLRATLKSASRIYPVLGNSVTLLTSEYEKNDIYIWTELLTPMKQAPAQETRSYRSRSLHNPCRV